MCLFIGYKASLWWQILKQFPNEYIYLLISGIIFDIFFFFSNLTDITEVENGIKPLMSSASYNSSTSYIFLTYMSYFLVKNFFHIFFLKHSSQTGKFLKNRPKDADSMTYISDHLPSGLISFSVVGPFLFLLQNPFPGGSVLQSKFTNDPAELVYVHFPNRIRWMSHKEQKGMEPVRKNNNGNDFGF